ncbi:Mobile element protein [Bradyrhizobium sp.]|uniref:hypothetical protein n=1 Tax=Bradyrhizobium sp. TaxID=376 RepID=UPI0007C182E9|nr:hypothetical protein [Bradyrhizobium sp.]CUT12735.1 Mobile element protein [Bradyrhizobium sp.]
MTERQCGRTIWDAFEAERPKLVPYAGRFDGFHAVTASVSKTCLVRASLRHKPFAEARHAKWTHEVS